MSALTPQSIADWLETLGLGQYAQRFVENRITVSILPDLADADLKELGVSALGHPTSVAARAKILDNAATHLPSSSCVTPSCAFF